MEEATKQALGRATRRVIFHVIQATIEGLKAVEAVIEEVGGIRAGVEHDHRQGTTSQRIEIE